MIKYSAFVYLLAAIVAGCNATGTTDAMTGTFAYRSENAQSILDKKITITRATNTSEAAYHVAVHAVVKYKDSDDNHDEVIKNDWVGYYQPENSVIHIPGQIDIILVPDSALIRTGQVTYRRIVAAK